MENDDNVDRPGRPDGQDSRPADVRRTPHSAAQRKRAIDSNAQVEEWRLRQATRAVPPEFSQAGRSRFERQHAAHAAAEESAASADQASVVEAEVVEEPADGKKRLKTVGVAAAVVAYLLVALFFNQHFYPGASIGSVDVGGLTVGQAADALADSVADYELQVEGENDVHFVVTASEAGLTLDADSLAQSAKDDEPGLLWPVQLVMPHDHSDVLVASAGASGFREKVSDAVGWYNQDATAPRDAAVFYDVEKKAFAISTEEAGNMLDEDAVARHVAEALGAMRPTLTLGEGDYLHPSVTADDPRLQEALARAEKALEVNVSFNAHGSKVATLDAATAAKWVTTDENAQVVLDEDAVNAWVQALVDKSSTVGNKRTWTREDGVECTVEGGVYGWEADWLAIDETLHDAISGGLAESVEIPMQQEAAVYNGEHGRDWKAYIDVDLDSQHATYYSDAGKVLWEADFVSGSPDGEHDTPQGVYYINNKESPSTLVGEANATGSPEYRTEVQFWMPWRGNDVGFHDADWQEEFGGTRYEDGFGSHGCINLSPEDAGKLYEIAAVDTVVVCHGSAKREG